MTSENLTVPVENRPTGTIKIWWGFTGMTSETRGT